MPVCLSVIIVLDDCKNGNGEICISINLAYYQKKHKSERLEAILFILSSYLIFIKILLLKKCILQEFSHLI